MAHWWQEECIGVDCPTCGSGRTWPCREVVVGGKGPWRKEAHIGRVLAFHQSEAGQAAVPDAPKEGK